MRALPADTSEMAAVAFEAAERILACLQGLNGISSCTGIPNHVRSQGSSEERMKNISRRELLKSSLLVPAAAAAQGISPMSAAIQAVGANPVQPAATAPRVSAQPGAGRERLLLDRGWRFHLGNANDLSHLQN